MDEATETSYREMLKSGRRIRDNDCNLPPMRVAILADHATQQFAVLLKAALMEAGYFPLVYEAGYSTTAIEAYDPNSKLHEFKPEFIYVGLSVQKYRAAFFACAGVEERDDLPRRYLKEILDIVDALARPAPAAIVVSNLALPVERMFGNYSQLTGQSLYASVLKFNLLLSEAAAQRGICKLNDVMYISGRIGAERFLDDRLWNSAKYPCATRFLPDVARSLAATLTAHRGKVTKCLVLDLDNTLWGGVIGDDGVAGISLGGDAVGEGFALFQAYVRCLKERGYVLAVCSKNDEETARTAFRSHPEMILKEEDIAVFVANWNDKASNVDFIARTLNIGLDSMILIDDSPFERNQVRAALPMVIVPELPEDVSGYVHALEAATHLEATGFSAEDRRRSDMYREEAARAVQQIKYGNIDDYLKSLSMIVECVPFRDGSIARIAQLIQRSNQFNLRTQRMSEADCRRYMEESGDRFGLQVRLRDRFGDYGLILAVCCDVVQPWLFIAELVMSCRVLKRGVEQHVMNVLFDECRRRSLQGVCGEYIRTAKNGLVKDFFRQFDFDLLDATAERELWGLAASRYDRRVTFFSEPVNDAG